MLAANGMEPMRGKNGEPVKATVGPNTVLYGGRGLGDQGAGSWAYIEPSGTSLRFLEDRIERDIKHLHELGRLPLETPAPNMTVVSAAGASESSRSAVQSWSIMLEDALAQAMAVTGEWMNTPTLRWRLVIQGLLSWLGRIGHGSLAGNGDRRPAATQPRCVPSRNGEAGDSIGDV